MTRLAARITLVTTPHLPVTPISGMKWLRMMRRRYPVNYRARCWEIRAAFEAQPRLRTLWFHGPSMRR